MVMVMEVGVEVGMAMEPAEITMATPPPTITVPVLY
jgi:hypothetical protein